MQSDVFLYLAFAMASFFAKKGAEHQASSKLSYLARVLLLEHVAKSTALWRISAAYMLTTGLHAHRPGLLLCLDCFFIMVQYLAKFFLNVESTVWISSYDMSNQPITRIHVSIAQFLSSSYIHKMDFLRFFWVALNNLTAACCALVWIAMVIHLKKNSCDRYKRIFCVLNQFFFIAVMCKEPRPQPCPY